MGDEVGVEGLDSLDFWGDGVEGSRILEDFGEEVVDESLFFGDLLERLGEESRIFEDEGDDGVDDRNDLESRGDEGADDRGVSGSGRLGGSKTGRKKDAAEGAARTWRIGRSG